MEELVVEGYLTPADVMLQGMSGLGFLAGSIPVYTAPALLFPHAGKSIKITKWLIKLREAMFLLRI